MASTTRSLLMVTVWARKGGAERLIVDLLERLSGDFRVALGLVRSVPESERTLGWDGPTVGLREILFGEWDLIHTHLFLPGLLVRLRRIWDGSFRWVHTVHYESYDSYRWGRLRRWLDLRFVFPATDVLVAVSRSGRIHLDRFPQVRLIENAIPLDPVDGGGSTAVDGDGDAGSESSPHPTTEGVRSTSTPGGPEIGKTGRPGPVIGTVAHLREEKGLDDLLRAVDLLRTRFPSLRLRIAGEGGLRKSLEEEVEELDLEESVELCGFVRDLDSLYRSLDVYVQPSRTEPFGLAALESMRFGLPLVAAEVGFLPEMLGYGRFGELVGRGEGFVERLARSLERVIGNADEYRRRAARGREHWSALVSPDRMQREYREAYRAALRPRICMVQPIVTRSYAGLSHQLLLQSRELAGRGHRVFIVQRSDPLLKTDPERAERWRHAEVRGAGRISDGSEASGGVAARIRGLRFILGGLVQLWRIRHRFDVIHAHQLYSPTIVGALGKLFLGKPLVVKVTSSGELGERAELERLPFPRLRRLTFRTVDRLLVLTDSMGAEMRALGFSDDRIRLLPNSVEVDEPNSVEVDEAAPRGTGWPRTTADDPSASPYRILFTGRISREKRLDTLLEAVGILAARRAGPELEVEIVGGPDPDRDATSDLRELATRLPGSCRIHFRGFRPDVDRFYRAADAFVLPSATEGLSNALLEAMARGLPCVVSDIPANRFAVGEAAASDGADPHHEESGAERKAGILFRQGSPESLARQLERLIEDRELNGRLADRLGRRARRRARERFSVDSVVDDLQGIYAEVLDG